MDAESDDDGAEFSMLQRHIRDIFSSVKGLENRF